MAASSSSSSGLGWKYDVFINFRGEDIRRGFVSHLYNALVKKPINAFIDAEKLRKGDHLSELLKAIRGSRISIVVFSLNYASSTWCLKELVQILECKDTNNQIVLPIFYEVDPSDVRKLKRSFAEAFAQHDRDSNAEMEEVQSWRSALTTATSLSGWDSRNYENDAVLIEKIVEDVYRKLIDISSSSRKENGLVGMDSRMRNMHLLLYPPGGETNNVRVVGIWGMGGLGKTTIARAVYDEISCRFEACCFLENIKEAFMKQGKLHLQTELLSSISNNKVGSSDISKKGFQVMLNSLGQRNVLIVLDDVDTLEQIEALLGEQHSFGGGSRIIITTRDSQLLSIAGEIYNPQILSDSGALELFRRYAFRKNQPTRDYDDLSRRAVKYARGLPLALKVLGAFLDNKNVRQWENELEKIKKIPQKGIHDVLKTSFDGLDDTEKDIFLDIACYFKGMREDCATEVLHSCGFYPDIGIKVLIDRALVTVSTKGELEMHDLLEEMGQKIVYQESIKEPGRRSRLWSYEDVFHVITKNTGTETVESIILDSWNSDEGCLIVEAFDRMTKLRLLKISAHGIQHLTGPLKFVSSELRCLSWSGYPLKSLPSNFQFENLVGLDMQYSLIDRLWEGTQTQEKLKFINLSNCQSLKETPDFTNVPNLETLILQSCTSLVEVHPSISTLTNLVLLDLNGCEELKILPNKIRMRSLKTFNLFGCSNLEMFPEISEGMEELEELNLSYSKIKELPLSINNLTGLSHFNLKDCKELKSLPSCIHMKCLKTFNLDGCSSLEMFPSISEGIEGLEKLDLPCSKIKELSPSINNLTRLSHLNLQDCKELKSLPSSIRMKSLKTLNLCGCSSLEMFPDISEGMEELEELNLSGSKIKELPLSINNLSGLSHFNLKDCKELKILPSKIRMRSLKTFNLCDCSSLEMFPEISEGMEELEELNLSGSKIKELSLSINNLTRLSHFNLKDCKELKSLPSCIHMKCLKTFNLYGCFSLEMFPSISEGIEGLEKLDLPCSKIKELSWSINNLTRLCHLNLHNCKDLKSLPSSIRMISLKTLNLSGCSSLEMFPEISEGMEGLEKLDLSRSKIKELPPSINNLTGLSHLDLSYCKELKSLPSIIRMKSLKTLNLSCCSSLEMFPEISEGMEGLEKLNLSRSKIKEMPPSINNLTGLSHLDLSYCKELKSLPSSIRMKSLKTLNICGCSSLEMFPEIPEVIEGLKLLDLSGSKIKELPSSINNLTGLSHLSLGHCKELKCLPSSICHLKSLVFLSLSGCTKFEVFPSIEENMEGLRKLFLDGTSIKELSPWIERLTGLQYLHSSVLAWAPPHPNPPISW
ncbi:disease resistance protein RPV1-like isoform X3 [Malus sylvestris]|uniref:disease resistance protein RPV1-like isoform X3 n=1 Tax=Malus sylvestris TaxID=3752 RepID=UPI0021ACC776|nr:disease resistance protein RPV1-like isoform X3 [Malus sylvestris]